MKYKVIKDTREKNGSWDFSLETLDCQGMNISTLKIGDYSIEGLEESLCIERKGTLGEFAFNIFEPRFHRELEKLNQFKFAYLILEFDMMDIINYPVGSGIPKSRWHMLKTGTAAILSNYLSLQHKYPNIKFILAGQNGRKVAECIFKKMMKYVEQNKTV